MTHHNTTGDHTVSAEPLNTNACGWIRPLTKTKDRDELALQAYNYLKLIDDQFDAFAVTGYSATIIGTVLAHQMRKNLIVIRKPCDVRNSSHDVEGPYNQKCILVDDCICSGETFRRVEEGLKTLNSELLGVYLYNSEIKYIDTIKKYKVLHDKDSPTELGNALASSARPPERRVHRIGSLVPVAEVAL